MKKINILPDKIPVFPLSNFIIFPGTTVTLNIFEPRYVQMIDDSMKGNRMIGIIQPKKKSNNLIPELHEVGCVGKIISFNESKDQKYLIILKGLNRFKIIDEIKNNKLYREYRVNFKNDISLNKNEIKFSDLQLIFKDLKSLFEKKGYVIDWKGLEKQSLEQTINTIAMASPFSLEEKQILLETEDLNSRKNKLEQILITYMADEFNNTTIQ
jgi:Lon protease-like protein